MALESLGPDCPVIRLNPFLLAATVRLVNPGSDNPWPSQGRLEVKEGNVWTTVCDDGFSDREASIVCKQLGFGEVGTAITKAAFGPGTGDILYDDVVCTGSEDKLQQCSHSTTSDCTHSEDVSVVCPIGIGDGVEPEGTRKKNKLIAPCKGIRRRYCCTPKCC